MVVYICDLRAATMHDVACLQPFSDKLSYEITSFLLHLMTPVAQRHHSLQTVDINQYEACTNQNINNNNNNSLEERRAMYRSLFLKLFLMM
jgi:hypothetical protein